MTNAEALQFIKDNRNHLDFIIDGTDSAAQFVRTSDTFDSDNLISQLREALWMVVVGIHEDEIIVAP